MGAAAALFHSSNSDNQTLHHRIKPSAEQLEEQQDRWNELAEFLEPELRKRTGYSTRTWLQGSYKFRTQIRPVRMTEEFDIDLGFYFVWDGNPSDGLYGPKALKDFIQESLEEFAKNTEGVKGVATPKPRCARIRYSNSFHIDIPTYHLSGTDERSLATEHDHWEDSDPKAIYTWFKDAFTDADRSKVRRLIRYAKAWAALKFKLAERPSSILLTVLIADAALELGLDNLGSEDEAFANIVSSVLTRVRYNHRVPNPVAPTSEDLGARLSPEQWSDFIAKLGDLDEVAVRALTAESERAAADIWEQAFEHLFPMPAVEVDETKSTTSLPALRFMPEISVTATPRNNRHKTIADMNRIGPIPRNCTIVFEVVNSSQLPPGSEVHWVVRNEGRAAELENDLGHVSGKGLRMDEHSAYHGRHFMDCTVKRYGITIAFRRVPVEINSLEAPPRNPARRPAWTTLRNSRR